MLLLFLIAPAFPTLLEIVAAYDAQSMAVNSITVMWNEVVSTIIPDAQVLFMSGYARQNRSTWHSGGQTVHASL